MKALLNKYAAIITEYKISAWEIQPSSSRWKAHIRFSDGSFPHHKHVGSETNVLPSREVCLEDVLEYIHAQISQ